MSIPELATLMFIISLWVLSIFCCIKRYEKISTIERADMPQYRKNALDPLANSASSTASKSPLNVASPILNRSASPPMPNSPSHFLMSKAANTTTNVPTEAGAVGVTSSTPTTTTTTAAASTLMYSSSSRLLASTNNRDSSDCISYGANNSRAAGEQALIRMLSAYNTPDDSASVTNTGDTAQGALPKQQIYYEVVLNDERRSGGGACQYQKNQNASSRQRSNNAHKLGGSVNNTRRQSRGVAQKQLSMQLPCSSNPGNSRASMGSIPYSHFKNVSFFLILIFLFRQNFYDA